MNTLQRGPTRERKSVILHGLHRFSAWLYALVLHSMIGRFLTNTPSKSPKESDDGFLHRLFRSKKKRSDRILFRCCHALAATLEQSVFCRLIGAIERALLRTGINSYGIFLLFFGCYSVVSYYVLSGLGMEVSLGYPVTGGVLILASLPMFASSHSMAWGLRKSVIFRAIIVYGFGIAEERLTSYGDAGREHHLEALILALLSGTMTFFVAPYHLLLGAGVILLILLVLRDPEVGMVPSVGLLPFLSLLERPTFLLLGMMSVTLLGYVNKWLCGKRTLRVETTDGMVFFFLVLVALGGIVTRGGTASLHSALTYVFLGTVYFIVANLVRSQAGVWRMVSILLISGTAVSLLGIWQYVFSTPTLEYLDLNLFPDLGGRVSSAWGNPNMLAEYLALLLPLAFAVLLLQRRLLRGFGTVLCIAAMVFCMVFTWSRGAWLGVLIALLLMALCLNHKVLSWLILGAIPTAALLPFAPETVLRRFASIGSRTDSSILYRLHLWDGVENMLRDVWLTGVGVGESAFCAVYTDYALPGIETAMHSHSLYLQLMCDLGIIGVLVFGIVMLLWLRRMLGYVRYGQLRAPRLIVLASVSGVVALLIMGAFDYVWYNYRIYMLFWALMGLGTAQVRIGERETERAHTPLDDERTQGEVVLRFY